MKKTIREASSTPAQGGLDVDDGPRFFYGNQKTYKQKSLEMAKMLGREILDYISIDGELEDHNTDYPNGPHSAVSYFPVGDKKSENSGTNYYVDITTSQSYRDYAKWVESLAKRMGRDIMKSIISNEDKENLTKY